MTMQASPINSGEEVGKDMLQCTYIAFVLRVESVLGCPLNYLFRKQKDA